jgi:hypothetical protein
MGEDARLAVEDARTRVGMYIPDNSKLVKNGKVGHSNKYFRMYSRVIGELRSVTSILASVNIATLSTDSSASHMLMLAGIRGKKCFVIDNERLIVC